MTSTFRITLTIAIFYAGLILQKDLPAIAMVGLCIWALRGPDQAIQALTLGGLMKFLNPALYPDLRTASMLGWVLLALAGARVWLSAISRRGWGSPVLFWLAVFGLAVLLHSATVSRQGVLSAFKLVSFVFGATTVLLAFQSSARRKVDWTPWFVGLWSAVVLLSAPTVFFPSIGYLKNGWGFQGILGHPQSFGAFLAVAVAWFGARLILYPLTQTHWMLVLIGCLAWVELILTKARTGLLAVLAGLACVALLAVLKRYEWRQQFTSAFRKPLVLLLLIVVITMILLDSSTLENRVEAYVFKHGHDAKSSITDAYTKSRGAGLSNQWTNFLRSPLVGHGFGIAPYDDPDAVQLLDPIFGLPLSAPTEKGFLPTAILEETGIVGTMFLLLLLSSLFRYASGRGDSAVVWSFYASILVNVGEMVFFSFGGLGLYTWLIIGWASNCQPGVGDET